MSGPQDDFFLTNLELRDSTETGEQGAGLSHASMAGLVLLQVLELAARGEPRGAVTVLHDVGDHSGRYRGLAARLAEAGWAVALPDMRGHGGSEGERGHCAGIREVVRDLTDVQDHLAYRLPDAPKILVGQGVGALHAITFAKEAPGIVAGLVLVSPLHDPFFRMPEPPKGLFKSFKKYGPHSTGSIGYTADQLSSDPELTAAYGSDDKVHDLITVRAAEQYKEMAEGYLAHTHELDLPILVVHGKSDPITSFERSKAMLADNVRVELIEEGRHHLLQDRMRTQVEDVILGWLDDVLPR